MANLEPKKCAHPACRCSVPDDKKYCSQCCEDGGQEVEISCDWSCALSE